MIPVSVLCSGYTQLRIEEYPGTDYPSNALATNKRRPAPASVGFLNAGRAGRHQPKEGRPHGRQKRDDSA